MSGPDRSQDPVARDPRLIQALAVALSALRTDLQRVPAPPDARFPDQPVDIAATLQRAYDAARHAGFSAFTAVHLVTGELRTTPGANAGHLARAKVALERLRTRELGSTEPA